ncbi:PREDICTED: DNA repair protein XRCC3 isoform X1 [Dipodomys ordii]|uniref:DNA repair protein XRCC3 isoform X1 n=1 Tax=Dipodomys ordii TaxID=10020 RepID=A0A1S3F2I3_DIPOR|nr:PREDICTED: DNA repair protein XRCC3 isoform X1 [Dipodomys ordii]
MDLDQLDLNPRIIAAVKRAKLKSVKEVLHFSGPDLQRLTGLSSPDVQHLLTAASLWLRGPHTLTALHLVQQKERFPVQHQRLSLGCPVLDRVLGGGLPLGGITELAGCSSAGKTQLALQLSLAVQFPQQHGGLEAGAVYICTEDVFPSKRLQQLIAQQQRLRMDVPSEVVQKIKFSNHIFIEHAADVDTLLECVRKKVPVLLSRGMARLVVIDSVAAPFRCEFDKEGPALRARHLQSLGAELRRLSSAFQAPVLCINQVGEAAVCPDAQDDGEGLRRGLQGALVMIWKTRGPSTTAAPIGLFQVTEAVEEQGLLPCLPGPWDPRLSPALGIAWANQLLMRLMADRVRAQEAVPGLPGGLTRTLRVLFAPHLPPSSCSYTVGCEGVRGAMPS